MKDLFETYKSKYTGNKYNKMMLLDAICYSRMYPNSAHLTPGQCMMVHQLISGIGNLHKNTWFTVDYVTKKIEEYEWERPNFEYDPETRKLKVYKPK